MAFFLGIEVIEMNLEVVQFIVICCTSFMINYIMKLYLSIFISLVSYIYLTINNVFNKSFSLWCSDWCVIEKCTFADNYICVYSCYYLIVIGIPCGMFFIL